MATPNGSNSNSNNNNSASVAAAASKTKSWRYNKMDGFMPEIERIKNVGSRREEMRLLKDDFSHAKNAMNDDFCSVCQESGVILCCDTCLSSFHLQCHEPVINQVPAGSFQCNRCKNTPAHLIPPKSSRLIREPEEQRNARELARILKPLPKTKDALELAKASVSDLVKASIQLNAVSFQLPTEMKNEIPGPWPHESTSHQREPIFGEICSDCKNVNESEMMVRCDFCNRYYHLECLEEPLCRLPRGIWMCPLHIEHFIDHKLVKSESATERAELWEKYGRGPLDPVLVMSGFFRKLIDNRKKAAGKEKKNEEKTTKDESTIKSEDRDSPTGNDEIVLFPRRKRSFETDSKDSDENKIQIHPTIKQLYERRWDIVPKKRKRLVKKTEQDAFLDAIVSMQQSQSSVESTEKKQEEPKATTAQVSQPASQSKEVDEESKPDANEQLQSSTLPTVVSSTGLDEEYEEPEEGEGEKMQEAEKEKEQDKEEKKEECQEKSEEKEEKVPEKSVIYTRSKTERIAKKNAEKFSVRQFQKRNNVATRFGAFNTVFEPRNFLPSRFIMAVLKAEGRQYRPIAIQKPVLKLGLSERADIRLSDYCAQPCYSLTNVSATLVLDKITTHFELDFGNGVGLVDGVLYGRAGRVWAGPKEAELCKCSNEMKQLAALDQPARLRHGSFIEIGCVRFVFATFF